MYLLLAGMAEIPLILAAESIHARLTSIYSSKRIRQLRYQCAPKTVPDADALMNPTERLKDEQPSVLNEILQTSHQEKVIHQYLESMQK